MCGFNNPAKAERCSSCGAKIEAFGPGALTDEELYERRYQQDGFVWKWAWVAFGIYMALQGIILGVLPMVIDQYDPQGLPGLVISAAVWFVGGIIVGYISPGKTFIEPAVGAMLAAVPTVAWLKLIADVYELSLIAYIVFGMLGVMVTLFGAFLGEKFQMGAEAQA